MATKFLSFRMVRLSKVLADKNLIEEDKNFIVPVNLVIIEFQSMLFKYLSTNLAYWDIDIVKHLLKGMRDAAKTKCDLWEETSREGARARSHFINRTNGTLRWMSRLTRDRQIVRILDYLKEEDKLVLLSRDLNYSERQFGLRQLPGTNPLTVARRFAEEYDLDQSWLDRFESELSAYSVKFETAMISAQ